MALAGCSSPELSLPQGDLTVRAGEQATQISGECLGRGRFDRDPPRVPLEGGRHLATLEELHPGDAPDDRPFAEGLRG